LRQRQKSVAARFQTSATVVLQSSIGQQGTELLGLAAPDQDVRKKTAQPSNASALHGLKSDGWLPPDAGDAGKTARHILT